MRKLDFALADGRQALTRDAMREVRGGLYASGGGGSVISCTTTYYSALGRTLWSDTGGCGCSTIQDCEAAVGAMAKVNIDIGGAGPWYAITHCS